MGFDTALPREISAYPLSAQTRQFFSGTHFGHVIDGEMVDARSGQTLPIREPATGVEFARVAAGTREDVDQAVRSARRSYDDGRWRHLPPAPRE
jgi:hypothetical protein